MLTQTIIRNFLQNNISQGTTLHISQILIIIKNYFPLNKDDWAPHTATRPTHYPRWAHRVQGTLSFLKGKGLVTHNLITNTYTF